VPKADSSQASSHNAHLLLDEVLQAIAVRRALGDALRGEAVVGHTQRVQQWLEEREEQHAAVDLVDDNLQVHNGAE
jgi:hypothetical protein